MSNYALLQEHHPLRIYKVPCGNAIDIHTARNGYVLIVRAVPYDIVVTRL